MFRLLLSCILAGTTVLLSFAADGMGSPEYSFQTWYGAFMLPIWSIFAVSLWHDIGRQIWNFNKWKWAEPYAFVLWMGIMFTYIIALHIQMWALPLLFVIPVLSIPFRRILTYNWDELPTFTWTEFSTLIWWAVSAYLVYWVLNAAWIILRISIIEWTTDSVIFYMQ